MLAKISVWNKTTKQPVVDVAFNGSYSNSIGTEPTCFVLPAEPSQPRRFNTTALNVFLGVARSMMTELPLCLGMSSLCQALGLAITKIA